MRTYSSNYNQNNKTLSMTNFVSTRLRNSFIMSFYTIGNFSGSIPNTVPSVPDGVGIVMAILMATLAIADVNSTIENGLISTLSAPASKNMFTSDSSAFPVTPTFKTKDRFGIEK